ncbi:MAG TPA: hypothetical protein VG328_10290 [Stellaceae bacterium]|jgi:hypothetical protein|nr:hypothetical protein [Stellaceae bacterium]
MRVRCFWVKKLLLGYRRLDTGERFYGRLPAGALYVAPARTLADGWECKGADGLNVVCVTPSGPWYIDSRAGNCERSTDFAHRCWIRHGTIGENLHVDKDGNTCSAGNGSIQCGKFHGYLHNGELYEA